MSGSEIVEGWEGKRVLVSVADGGHLRGELVRSDAAGVLFAVEEMIEPGEIGSEWTTRYKPTEDSSPMFCFVPWSRIQMLAPRPGELP